MIVGMAFSARCRRAMRRTARMACVSMIQRQIAVDHDRDDMIMTRM